MEPQDGSVHLYRCLLYTSVIYGKDVLSTDGVLYYTMEELYQLYKSMGTEEEQTAVPANPETGGVWEVYQVKPVSTDQTVLPTDPSDVSNHPARTEESIPSALSLIHI